MKPIDMPVKNIRAYVGDTVNNNRSSGDFYGTPEKCTEDLLERETFDGPIWECPCSKIDFLLIPSKKVNLLKITTFF